MNQLEGSLKEFRRRFDGFEPTAEHLVPDLALAGLLKDVHENAVVAEQISKSGLPHRGFANARAAFEASQQALLLCTAEDYDRAGARAWVYFLKKDRDFSKRHPDAADVLGYSPVERFDMAVKEIAEVWEELAAGKGALIHQVVPVVEKQARRPDNWAGVPVAKELAERLTDVPGGDDKAGALAAFDNAYAALSRGTHPRTSLRPESIKREPSGRITVVLEDQDVDGDRETIEFATAGALNLGSAALGLRSTIR